MEESFGEKAVGMSFNPSADPRVQEIKRRMALTIDMLHDMRMNRDYKEGSEYAKEVDYAIKQIQSAQMWAVKVITRSR